MSKVIGFCINFWDAKIQEWTEGLEKVRQWLFLLPVPFPFPVFVTSFVVSVIFA